MEPITRKEMFLAGAAGQDVPQLTPKTREEYFISQISAGGGGGGGGASAVTLYPDFNASPSILYKDEDLTQGFATAEEAISFIEDNPLIRVMVASDGQEGYALPSSYVWGEDEYAEAYAVSAFVSPDTSFYLYIGDGPDPDQK